MTASDEIRGIRLLANGVVQGVGFRPFVYHLAKENELTGWVQNSSAGVVMEINGPQNHLDKFLHSLESELPPLARIESLTTTPVDPAHYTVFEIRPSEKRADAFSLIPPDVAICDDCRRELFDPSNHRYRYPFINCTNCGPRFSIIQDMPYDRPATTMADFPLCPVCGAEYNNPEDRRFHAQPIACPTCGPQVSFYEQDKLLARKEEAIQLARRFIREGMIVAVKGLGGFLLACDAANETAVTELRRRKRRSDKAFALMAFDVDTIRKYCDVSPEEADLLTSRQMPIVILPRNGTPLPAALAPGQTTLGVMLPYTPLHLLLCEPEPRYPDFLVMTSANISEEPIIYRDEEIHKLDGLADGFLTHDRPIHIRMDDSVVRFSKRQPVFLRRSRGYAPEPIPMPFPMPSILACGALLKNTFTFTKDRSAFMSPFIGDLENLETYAAFEHTLDHFHQVYKFNPDVYACDLHPDFLSTQYAQSRAAVESKPLIQVQHHHAHLAACLAENGWQGDGKVIGLSYDGTGLGNDNAIWGGEVLVGDYKSYSRAYHLEYLPLPGGDSAIRHPGKIALAYLCALGLPWDDQLASVKSMSRTELTILESQVGQKINTVSTSSMGRLFDAAAALAGVRQTVTYEGQAAIEFEAMADPSVQDQYLYEIASDEIKLAPLFIGLLDDIRQQKSLPVISAKFHNTIAALSVDVCYRVRTEQGIHVVALSGGVWQNLRLFEKVISRLEAGGFTVLRHHLLPPNDGCISFGQAVIAGSGLQ
jgi:hydrogenase maturation protein HypF